jgi:hypothetical protein
MTLGNDQLFILGPARRLEVFFGLPHFQRCGKPLMNREMPIFTYESDEERFTNCACNSNPRLRGCGKNYYSPFE